jgi:hypothetical protein
LSNFGSDITARVREVESPYTFDPQQNPDLANQMVRDLTVKTASTPPMLEEPPGNTFILPGGYLDPEGRLHREAKIKEIIGADEEVFAREWRNPNLSIARVVDLMLRRTVVSIGDIDVTPEMLGSLLIGDRAALLLGVRYLTFGTDWEVEEFPCRLCGETFGVIIELDKDIPMRELPDPRRQEVNVKLRNGKLATVALMTGAVQLQMVADDNRTGAEQQTFAIDHLLKTVGGEPVHFPMAQQMGMADRRKIVQAVDDAQPGPQMEEVMVKCEKCGGEAKYTVGLMDLFR